MGTYRNATTGTIDLTSGRTLAPDSTVDLASLPEHESGLVAGGALQLVSGTQPPAPLPAPTRAYISSSTDEPEDLAPGYMHLTVDESGAPQTLYIGVID